MTILSVTAPTFTRPNDTTAYTAGDLVANSTSAASVVALQWRIARDSMPKRQIKIVAARIVVTGAGAIANKTIGAHLFEVVPTFQTGGDNSATSSVVATAAANGFIGSLQATCNILCADGSLGQGGPISSSTTSIVSAIPWNPSVAPDAGGFFNIYGFLEARAGYTPAAQETYSVSLLFEPVVDGAAA